jgi:gas vesicle protein
MDLIVLLKWLVGGLLTIVGGLVVYIWNEHRTREKEDRSRDNEAVGNLNKALAAAFEKMEGKLERAVKAMEGAVATVGKSLSEKIDGVESRLDNRIDDLEEKQVAQGKETIELRQYTRGIVRVCEERARHCPMFAAGEGMAHFHRRMGEHDATVFCHRRQVDSGGGHDGSDY